MTAKPTASAKNRLLQDVDFSLMGHGDPKRTQGGTGIAIVYSRVSESNRDPLTYQVCRPAPEVLVDDAPTKVREEALAALPYVRTGFHLQDNPQIEVKDGKHTVLFAVSEEIGDHMRRLDEANIQVVIKHAKDWFKKALSPELVRNNYSAVVTRYPTTEEVSEDQKNTCIRVKVIEKKTEILVQDSESYKKFRPGTIRDLKRNARVVLVLEDRGIYFLQSQSGGQLFAKRILIFDSAMMNMGNLEFDLGDGMEIEIEQPFEPQAVGTAPPTTANRNNGPGFATAYNDPSVTDQTMVNGGTAAEWQRQNEFAGPAVMF